MSTITKKPSASLLFKPSTSFINNNNNNNTLLVLLFVLQMDKIEIKFPNVHAYEFDLSKFKSFGFTENKQVGFR